MLQMAEFRYRGREITSEDILYIRELIARASARQAAARLSAEVVRSLAVEAGQRRVARHGVPRPVADAAPRRPDRVAAGAVTYRTIPGAARAAGPVLIDTTPVEGRSRSSSPLEFEQVRRTADEPLFNSLMEEHHYLGYEQPVGEHLKYLVWAQGRPMACMAWSSAPRHLGAATAISAGTRKRAGATSASSLTTRAS